jgi:hypothetical protein
LNAYLSATIPPFLTSAQFHTTAATNATLFPPKLSIEFARMCESIKKLRDKQAIERSDFKAKLLGSGQPKIQYGLLNFEPRGG